MKAKIFKIGTVCKDGIIDGWGFDCYGEPIKKFINDNQDEPCCLGWSLTELEDISKAAQHCPLYKAGVLFR